MINAQLLDSTDRSIRTQISLTRKLKELIEEQALKKGQSLSEYLRRSALRQLQQDQKENKNLEQVADEIFGSLDLSKHPYWSTKKKVIAWQRALRREWK